MDWKADWIWLKDAMGEEQSFILARTVIECEKPAPARIHLSANHVYRLYVNGKFVGRGPDRADPRFPYFDSYDLLLHTGKNAVLCLIWHAQPKQPERTWCLYNGGPGFTAQIEVNGTLVTTDKGWKVRRGPGWNSRHGERISRFGTFRHLAQLNEAAEVVQASQIVYDDSTWTEPLILPAGSFPAPIERESPMLRRVRHTPRRIGVSHARYPGVINERTMREVPPGDAMLVQPSADGIDLTYDFGRPMGGFPEIILQPLGAGAVDVYTAEGSTWFLTDRLTFDVAGELWYEPMDWRGARYVKLHFRDLQAPVSVKAMNFVEMDYPFAEQSEFDCSDETLMRLWRICRDTTRAGVKDHPVDCVMREQALWIEDIMAHSRAIAACFGDMRPIVKAMRQVFRVMHEDGVVPVPGPVGMGYGRTDEVLPWSAQPLTLAVTLRDLFWQTGDAAFFRPLLPKLEKIYSHYKRYEDERGLLRTNPPGMPKLVCYGGWNYFLKEGVPSALNFTYAMSLNAAAQLAYDIGDTVTSAAWGQRAQAVQKAAKEAFWDPKRNLFIDGEQDGRKVEAVSPTANAWAVLGGGLRPNEIGGWAQAMRTDPGLLQPLSPYDATLILDAYCMLDLQLEAKELLDRYFGAIVRDNEPTLPEFFDATDDSPARYRDDVSRCHPYGAGFGRQAMKTILGLQPAKPAWKAVTIKPTTLGLTRASGWLPAPTGTIGIRWEKSNTTWNMALDIPAGIAAEIILPRLGWGRERLVIDGETVWMSDRRAELATQVERRPVSPQRREVRWNFPQGGSHCVRLESC